MVDRISRGIVVRIRQFRVARGSEDDRSRSDGGRDDESLYTEPTDEPSMADPVRFVSISPWYQAKPNGACGTWITKKSKSVLAGHPHTLTSTNPNLSSYLLDTTLAGAQ